MTSRSTPPWAVALTASVCAEAGIDPLFLRHGFEPAEALSREAAHYPSALRHATSLGIAGAAVALEARREVLRGRRRSAWRVVIPEHRVSLVRDGRWWSCA